MTGVEPAVPGLLGLPRDYLVAQLGAWRTGMRAAQKPDCMAMLAQRLQPQDITAVADWLAAQPLPAITSAAPRPPSTWPMPCGSAAP
jgi:cytochrome c553